MKDFFKDLYTYNKAANEKLIQALTTETPGETSISLLSHLLNAHSIWISRIKQETPVPGVWQIQKLQEMESINHNNHLETFTLLEKANPEEIIEYRTTSGMELSNSIRDIFFHIINHSTYHRAQIASELRKESKTPPATDYIIYTRDGKL